MANPQNRRIKTALAGPDFTPIEILNIDPAPGCPDRRPIAGSNPRAAPGGQRRGGPREDWKNIPLWEAQAATVPPKWQTGGARVILCGGVSDSIIRIGAMTDAMLVAYGNNIPDALAARAPAYKVRAGEILAETFFIPEGCALYANLVSGGLAAPVEGVGAFEVHWMHGG